MYRPGDNVFVEKACTPFFYNKSNYRLNYEMQIIFANRYFILAGSLFKKKFTFKVHRTIQFRILFANKFSLHLISKFKTVHIIKYMQLFDAFHNFLTSIL